MTGIPQAPYQGRDNMIGTLVSGDGPSLILNGHVDVVPAVAYGPRARNIHAADESVELASIVAGARSLARFLAGYYAAGGLRTAGAS